MKRFAIVIFLFLMPSLSRATDTWISSFTATTDTTQVLCGAPTYTSNKRAFLHSVVVSSPAVGGLTVFNSSASAVNKIADIDTSSKGQYFYDVVASTRNKGMTYSNSGTASVEILYTCY